MNTYKDTPSNNKSWKKWSGSDSSGWEKQKQVYVEVTLGYPQVIGD